MRVSFRSFASTVATILLFLGLTTPAHAAAGDLDPSFGAGGLVATGFAHGDAEANGVAIQADGKILAAGSTGSGVGQRFALVRYEPDGTLDPTFGTGGRVTTGFDSGNVHANAVIVQPNGKIVLAGGNGGNRFALARYNVDGSLDDTFGGDGKVTTGFVSGGTAFGLAIQPDGKLVAVGASSDRFMAARYNSNGTLDRTFNSDGKAPVTFSFGGVTAFSVGIQADGKIVLGGLFHSLKSKRFALARLDVNGELDPTFAGDGKVTTAFGSKIAAGHDLSIQPDGKIVLVGTVSGTAGSRFAMARYRPDGTLDPTFSGDGKQTTGFGFSPAFASDVALQGDGKIVAAGWKVINAAPFLTLARYTATGALDTTFGADGKITTRGGEALAVALQSDGKIVAVGGTGSRFLVARYQV